jgi:hypothetical protein
MQILFRILKLAWAGPYSAIGLMVGWFALVTGGHVCYHDGILSFWGGGLRWIVENVLPKNDFIAMTLGHTVIGRTWNDIEGSHEHELVHVRQFERWGWAMGPAYLFASILAYFRGKRFYRDNVFEVEAYTADEVRRAIQPPQ